MSKGAAGPFTAALANGDANALAFLRQTIGMTHFSIMKGLLPHIRKEGPEIISITETNRLLNIAMANMDCGCFSDAIEVFMYTIYIALLVCAEFPEDGDRARSVIKTCRIYQTALRLMVQNGPGSVRTDLETAALLTHFPFEPAHHMRAVFTAMKKFFAAAQYKAAKHFAQLLLRGGPSNSNDAMVARMIILSSDNHSDETPSVAYTFPSDSVICGATFTCILVDEQRAVCPICNAEYKLEYSGIKCGVCFATDIINAPPKGRTGPNTLLEVD